jgi:hypothetical protein
VIRLGIECYERSCVVRSLICLTYWVVQLQMDISRHCYTTISYRLFTSYGPWWRHLRLEAGTNPGKANICQTAALSSQSEDSRAHQSRAYAPRISPRLQRPSRVLPRPGYPFVCRMSFRPRRRSLRPAADHPRNQARGGSRLIGEVVATMFQPAAEASVLDLQKIEPTYFDFLPRVRPIT